MQVKKKKNMEQELNAIRAGVLGSNDGILTVVGVLFSVAAATNNQFTILIAGLADLFACAFSMASGEYASVSSQSDTEKAAVENARRDLKNNYQQQLVLVQNYYVDKGVTQQTALAIAQELMVKNPLKILVNVKYDIELDEYMNPWEAAFASLFSAGLGGIFPLLAMTFLPTNLKFVGTIIVTAFAVGLTGYLSAKLGKGLVKKAIIRNIIIGLITIAIHYGIGQLF
ncbi:VIT1/CCC1 transporter family protein [Periweissella beninensis]|uniref:VIT family protein n=1 Tax=Periweissella beninensis TaxID=504936 RepID=A0ABT0VF05_9LACO|nr:VIT family protein [Periweissella beninensis]MBM7543458.1 VIT1/CCC1 family predicted Fe2+/Mn2+ transporter [Periweissella beninensis]MCM2436442.1 VIT family protein [Periweissella beninensis]MCT4396826.1 VIT family protein [Periweissella beninensis]